MDYTTPSWWHLLHTYNIQAHTSCIITLTHADQHSLTAQEEILIQKVAGDVARKPLLNGIQHGLGFKIIQHSVLGRRRDQVEGKKNKFEYDAVLHALVCSAFYQLHLSVCICCIQVVCPLWSQRNNWTNLGFGLKLKGDATHNTKAAFSDPPTCLYLSLYQSNQ